MLYKQKESKFWWTKFNHGGKVYRRSTNCTLKSAAKTEARRIRVEVEQEYGPGGRTGLALTDLEELHIQRIKNKGLGDRREETVKTFWSHLKQHLPREVSALTANEIAQYEGKRRAEKAKGQTIRREVQALKLAIKLAKRENLLHKSPIDWDLIDPIESDEPDEAKSGKSWDVKTVKRVFAALSKKAKCAGYHEMLRLILKTGLRLEEFRRIQPDWVKPAPKGSRIPAILSLPATATKTGKSRTLPLDYDCVRIIEKRCSQFATKKFNHALVLACEKLKLPIVLTPRDLRATYLTLAATSDPLAAQKLGGHANIATTGLYLHADDLRAMRAGQAAQVIIGVGIASRRKRQNRNIFMRARSSSG